MKPLLGLFSVVAIPAVFAGCGGVEPQDSIAVTKEALVSPTTGQPGAPTVTCGSPNATMTPGNAVNAKGSPFDPNGQAGAVYAGNPGTASLAHANSAAAVSQYDVACLQVTTH
jgi:hypothetical protein